MLGSVLVYGLFGYVVEYAFTLAAGRPKLPSPEMLPLYGLAALMFPPVRDAVSRRSAMARAATYGAAMVAGEYAIGRALRATVGIAPWTYSSRFAIDGLTRVDYLPLWALFGLALERIDDALRPAAS